MTSKKHRHPLFVSRLFLFFGLLFLASCGAEPEVVVIERLDEHSLVQVSSLMMEEGISIKKTLNTGDEKDKTYQISVPKKNEAAALAILSDNNFPRPRIIKTLDVCKDDSLLGSSPAKIRCQLKVGQEGKMVESLLKITGVRSADVTLVLPEASPFDSNPPRPTASVILDVTNTPEGLALSEGDIKPLVASAVENLDSRDVQVRINPPKRKPKVVAVEPAVPVAPLSYVSIAGLKMAPEAKNKFKIYALVALGLLLLLAALLVLSLLKVSKLRGQLKNSENQPDASTALVPQENGTAEAGGDSQEE